jgi:transmembrane sensor
MTGAERRLDEAGDWLVRLQSEVVSEADALAFDAWLSTSPDNAEAFDAVLKLSHEVEASRLALKIALPRPQPERSRRWVLWGGGLAAGAMAASAATLMLLPAATQSYATGPGERRKVTLADGSVLEMNGATRLEVRFAGRERRVELASGEASFDVAHDARRPFIVAAGDRAVRVLGTRFNVKRRGGRLSVALTRGLVEVASNGGTSRRYRLHPGQRLDAMEGAVESQIVTGAAEEAFGWREGRLIYRDATLGEVVDDLNAQFARPTRIEDPSLAAVKLSGVLVLDDQRAVINRLSLLTPIEVIEAPSGVLLRRAQQR